MLLGVLKGRGSEPKQCGVKYDSGDEDTHITSVFIMKSKKKKKSISNDFFLPCLTPIVSLTQPGTENESNKDREAKRRKEEEKYFYKEEEKNTKQNSSSFECVPRAEHPLSLPWTRRRCPSKLLCAAHQHIITLLPFLTSCVLACELKTRRLTTEAPQANPSQPHRCFLIINIILTRLDAALIPPAVKQCALSVPGYDRTQTTQRR